MTSLEMPGVKGNHTRPTPASNFSRIPLRQTMTTHHKFIDLYAQGEETASRPLIVYVHGGAWRSESKEMYRGLAMTILEQFRLPVALLEYRLSTKENGLRHPGHAEDVLTGLEELVNWPSGDHGGEFDRTRIYLVGHSAGGHILASIFLDGSAVENDNELDGLRPSERLMEAVQGIMLASGISDPEALFARYPSYDFIPLVFTEPYSRWNTLAYPLRKNTLTALQHGQGTRWHVVHSSGDMLVNLEQSEEMYKHLVEAYAAGAGAEGGGQGLISKDYETLSLDHYYTTKPAFASLVGGWAVRDIQKYGSS